MATGNDQPQRTRTMKASEFKAKCLKFMDEVAQTGDEIIITKNGQPVAKLAPYRERPKSWFGRDRDKLQILDDIISPIDVEWEADSDPDRVLTRDSRRYSCPDLGKDWRAKIRDFHPHCL